MKKIWALVFVLVLGALGAGLAWWFLQAPASTAKPLVARPAAAPPPAAQSPAAPPPATPETESAPADATPAAESPVDKEMVFQGVVQTADGDPVKDAVVRFEVSEEFSDMAVDAMPGEKEKAKPTEQKATTDETGAYTLKVHTGAAPAFLSTLACDAPGFARNLKPLHDLVKDGEATEVRVDFILQRGARVFGLVTNADGGAPVAEATVKLSVQRKFGMGFGFDEEAAGYQTRTGADGTYEISLPPGTYHASAYTEGRALLYVENAVPVVTLSTGQERQLDIPLAATAVLQGTVTPPANRAALSQEEFTLFANIEQDSSDIFSGNFGFDDSVGLHTEHELLADGRMQYKVTGLRMSKPYKVSVEATGIAPYESEPITIQPGQSPFTFDITLSAGSTLRGTATYEDGTIAANTAIELDAVQGPMLSPVSGMSSSDAIVTDGKGAFEITGVKAGEFLVDKRGAYMHEMDDVDSVIRRKGPPKESIITTDGVHDVNDIKIVLSGAAPGPPGSITGHVVDGTGAPVADAMVMMHDLENPGLEPQKSAADGTFKFDGVSGEEFSLFASKGQLNGSQSGVNVGDDVTITLLEQSKVSGIVTDAAGNPVPHCGVKLHQVREQDANPVSFFEDRMDFGRGEKTNDAGGFELDGVSAGRYTVRAKSDDAGSGESAVFEIAEGESKLGISIVLKPGTRFGGQVVNGKGQPVVGARVTLRLLPPKDDPMASAFSQMPDEFTPPDHEVHTGDDGKFEMRSVVPGAYALAASAEGLAPARDPNIEIVAGRDYMAYRAVLSQGGCIVGTAQSGGKIKKGLQVTAMGEGLGQRMAKAEEDGHFELCGLAAGTYQVSVFDMDEQMRGGGMNFSTPRMKSVEVKENQTTEVDFAPAADAGSISGTIHGVRGMTSIVVRPPSAGAAGMEAFGTMMAEGGAGGFAMAQQDGPFNITEITAGAYVIEVYSFPVDQPGFDPTTLINSPPKPIVSQPITVTAGQTTNIELTLPVADGAGENAAAP